jgi:RHS repeat-associated protein
VSQTVDGVTTNYALDQVSGLTQVLSDRANSYLYGNRRIAQYGETEPEYFLTDGLGSVRQLVDNSGAVILSKNYQPYGGEPSVAGNGYSSYGFTGEMTDLTGLVYLRARYYEPGTGRLTTKDVWQGDSNNPMSLNSWLYAYSNPIRYSDPSGFISQEESEEADRILAVLLGYGVKVQKDWGFRSIHELDLVTESIIRTTAALKGVGQFKSAMGQVQIARWGSFPDSPAFAPPGPPSIIGDIVLPDYHFNQSNEYSIYTLIHEFGHVWDGNVLERLSSGLQDEIGTLTCQFGGRTPVCWFDIDAGKEDPPGNPIDPYAGKSMFEDWAESFATYIYPKYYGQIEDFLPLGPLRKQYVIDQINSLP